MTYRIAITGLGESLRHIHLPAYQRIPALEVVGGCDPVARPDAFPFPLFASVPEMLERTKPHVFTVATPPDSHFELARLGLQAGCHVFCEKPFMNSLDEADATIALSREVGRHVVVNNQFRFMRIHQAAKERIERYIEEAIAAGATLVLWLETHCHRPARHTNTSTYR
jgi:predicted dehydrogenase